MRSWHALSCRKIVWQGVQAGRTERQPDLSANCGTEQNRKVIQVLSAIEFACMTCPYFPHLNGTKFVPLQECFSEDPSREYAGLVLAEIDEILEKSRGVADVSSLEVF